MLDQSKNKHPKTDPNIDKSTFKCTHCNKIGHTKSRCFEIVGYPDWWDHNRDQWKKDSKKTSTVAVTEIKTEANVAEKVSALVVTTDYGGKFLNTSTPVINSAWIIDFGATDHMTFDSRQGEYQKEIQTLDCNYHISEEDESGQSELVNQEADVFIEIPNQSSSVEGVLNLEPDPFMKRLPHRHNRDIPKPTYEPELSTKVKYPMSNYVSNHRLSESNKSFVNQIRCMVSEKQCQKVCKLKKSLYELKQSPRAWFGRFTKLIRVFGYHQSHSDHTLFLKKQHGLKLCVEPNQVSTDKGRYSRLLGRLMYLAHTRPDLAYALSEVSQYMHNPGEQHMNAVMRILRYLKNAPRKGILFTKNVDHQSIEVYTDANWVGAVDDRRSTSGYFTFVGGNLVTWKSKKSNVVARSSAEAKFRAACDIAHNPVQHDRTKHVKVDRFFIKEKLDDKIVELPKIRSEDQLADILTKVAVSSRVFSKILDKLGMCDIYAPI
ncbi:Retrovirus-related Pol polyprotein from transposon RE1 [Vitis vinifera]|uniref:Retrovirus-related Pol polyprotein from transposon RE1 n=1 Tax=Vitis vinifera TaxID=29760 RepID=A0A438I6Y6_VITVI|nr:Retrovirus-related Pol polyprotein from transposon RE1 [Vitis vinifera]